MGPIETLTNEHGLIRQYLDCLVLAAEQIEEDRRPSRAFFEKALEFARTFANDYHHFKEEHVLFVQLAQSKGGELDAPLDALRYQHERGRELIAKVAGSLDGYAAHDDRRTGDLLEALAAYVALLRQHIHTEDHRFYPLARNLLGREDMERLSEEFTRQRERHGGDMFERSHKLVADMGSILTHLH